MQELIDKNYPKELLENREIIESQFVLSLYKNISLLDSYYNLIKIDKTIEKNSLKTDSGIFYYQIIKAMYDKGFKEVDSSTVQLFIRDKESIKKTFDTFGGIGYLFTKMLPNINEKNIETYYDNLIKSNAMINYYSIGFDIMRYYDKLKATNVSADDIIDFMTHLNEDCVVESVKNDRFIDLGIPEDFIEQCQSGQFLGLPFAKGNNILQYLTMGIPRGYLTMIGGYSGTGKTSFVFSEIIMGLVKNDIKCGILTNEQKARDFQILLLIYVLVNDLNYYTLIRKTFKSGNFTDEDIQKIKEAKDIINEKYSKNIRFLEANKNDVKSMCHDIRMESKKGCELFLYDTFKSSDDMSDVMWQQLLKESRMMHKLAQELDVAIVTNYQLALHTENLQRFLDAKVLSNGKQIKEVYSEMLFMRKLWNDEYTDCKFDVKPYVFARDANGKIKKEIGEDGKSKAVKEYITLDKDKRYMIFFLNKTRNNEDGICVLYEFRGNWNKWVEIGYCNVSTENRR